MIKITVFSLFLIFFVSLSSGICGQKIRGVVNKNIRYYDANGIEIGQFNDVVDDEIKGVEVLAHGKRGLIQINFRDRNNVWIRSSSVRVDLYEITITPPVTYPYDDTKPVSSGIGGNRAK
nr:hypothetical protein [uncultured Desulfobulbus sp.]